LLVSFDPRCNGPFVAIACGLAIANELQHRGLGARLDPIVVHDN
jgi:hypothetical protein